MQAISRLLAFSSFFIAGQAVAVDPIPPELARLIKQTEHVPLGAEIRASLEAWPGNMLEVESLSPAVAAFCADSQGRLAAPKGEWEATDHIRDRALPQARLLWIVRSGNQMVVHYERGGIAHSYHLLSVDITDQSTPVVLWKAFSWKGLPGFSSLLDAARHDKVFLDPVPPPSGAVGKPLDRGVPLSASQLLQRWQKTGDLIERSRAAQRVEEGGSARAKKLREDASAAHASAKQAIDAGQLEKGGALLREAGSLMFKAARIASQPEVTPEMAKGEYAARRRKFEALLAAGERLAKDRADGHTGIEAAKRLLDDADKLASENRYLEGLEKIDLALEAAGKAMRSLRGPPSPHEPRPQSPAE